MQGNCWHSILCQDGLAGVAIIEQHIERREVGKQTQVQTGTGECYREYA